MAILNFTWTNSCCLIPLLVPMAPQTGMKLWKSFLLVLPSRYPSYIVLRFSLLIKLNSYNKLRWFLCALTHVCNKLCCRVFHWLILKNFLNYLKFGWEILKFPLYRWNMLEKYCRSTFIVYYYNWLFLVYNVAARPFVLEWHFSFFARSGVLQGGCGVAMHSFVWWKYCKKATLSLTGF